jgi:hypothetical protein
MLFFVFSVFCIKNSFSQVVQKKADKWQLINGITLGPGVKKHNVIKNQVHNRPILINSKDTNHIRKKKYKVVKPPKVLKYGNQKSINTIRKEDE